MRRSLLAAAGLAGATIASTVMADALDRRRIKDDPLWQRLEAAPRGEQRTVTGAGGTPLNVELYGPRGAPPIVLIHGWVCALRFWRLQVQDLAADHRVVAYDVRGHGASGAPADGDWSLDTLADDLDCILDACVEQPAVLGGHSLGAMTIAAWAGRHAGDIPEQAKAAVIINTGLGDLISESLLLRTPQGFTRVRQTIGGAALGASVPLPHRPDPISHRLVRAVALSPAASPGAVRFSEDMVLHCPRGVRAGCGR
jgi:pimeloyl-ACP methyl ester carboxylesterase